jgi:hypothetical protein
MRSVLPFAAVLVLLAAGCGGSSGGKKTDKLSSALAYSRCMRSHGVPGFPDPTQAGGGIQIAGSGTDGQSPVFLAAQRTCTRLLPNGGLPTHTDRQRALARLLRTAQCMRAHGVRGFPDPTASPPASRSGHSAIMSNDGAWLAIPDSIDVRSPAFERASEACDLGLGG